MIIVFLFCLYIMCSLLSTLYFYKKTYGVSQKQLFKINFLADLNAFKRFLLLTPVMVIWYFITNAIFMLFYCGLDDPGITLLVADYPVQLLYIAVIVLPVLLVVSFQIPAQKAKSIRTQLQKSSLKFTTQESKKHFENTWISIVKTGNMIFVILMYLDLVFPIQNLCYIPQNSLKAIPVDHYRWAFVSGRNNLNAILKQGKSFSCDYLDAALITTKEQCGRCPNRKWTGQTCILRKCPSEAPIMAIDPNFRDNRGTYCRTCEIINNVAYFHTATPDECFKCPNVRKTWSSWNSMFNAYHCILN